MATKRTELAEAVLKLVAKHPGRQKTAQAVAGYLMDERRTKELHSLVRTLEELRFKQDGVLEISVTSARPLTASAKRQVADMFPEAKKVLIHEEINKELRGGVQVRALDKVADFSVQARLRQLRQGA